MNVHQQYLPYKVITSEGGGVQSFSIAEHMYFLFHRFCVVSKYPKKEEYLENIWNLLNNLERKNISFCSRLVFTELRFGTDLAEIQTSQQDFLETKTKLRYNMYNLKAQDNENKILLKSLENITYLEPQSDIQITNVCWLSSKRWDLNLEINFDWNSIKLKSYRNHILKGDHNLSLCLITWIFSFFENQLLFTLFFSGPLTFVFSFALLCSISAIFFFLFLFFSSGFSSAKVTLDLLGEKAVKAVRVMIDFPSSNTHHYWV